MKTYNNTAAIEFLTSNNYWGFFFTETPDQMNGMALCVCESESHLSVKISEGDNFVAGLISHKDGDVFFGGDNEIDFKKSLPTSLR